MIETKIFLRLHLAGSKFLHIFGIHKALRKQSIASWKRNYFLLLGIIVVCIYWNFLSFIWNYNIAHWWKSCKKISFLILNVLITLHFNTFPWTYFYLTLLLHFIFSLIIWFWSNKWKWFICFTFLLLWLDFKVRTDCSCIHSVYFKIRSIAVLAIKDSRRVSTLAF